MLGEADTCSEAFTTGPTPPRPASHPPRQFIPKFRACLIQTGSKLSINWLDPMFPHMAGSGVTMCSAQTAPPHVPRTIQAATAGCISTAIRWRFAPCFLWRFAAIRGDSRRFALSMRPPHPIFYKETASSGTGKNSADRVLLKF